MIVALLTISLLAVVRASNTEDMQRLAFAVADFSQDLYTEIGRNKHNIVYSPYGLHSALTMTMLGARGSTAREFKGTLLVNSFGNSANTVHEAYRRLIAELNDTKTRLYVANAIYVNSSFQIKNQFKNDVTSKYSALASSLNMGGSYNSNVRTVNQFMENKTNRAIRNFLQEGSLNASVALIVVSGMFFSGTWLQQFNLYSTARRNFQMLNGTSKSMSMMVTKMWVRSKLNVLDSDVVELPFKGDRFAFYIVLPRASNGITNLETSLATRGNVGTLFTNLTSRPITIRIPAMRFESDLRLKVPLEDLGIVKAFDSGDLSGITQRSNLHITEVIHKTLIDIMESGTIGPILRNISNATMQTLHNFYAYHPFMFFIRDRDTQQILIQGKFSG